MYTKLVSFIETHPSLAKGVIIKVEERIDAKMIWNKVAEELNALGPPIRDAEGWKKGRKYLKTKKYHIKQKLVRVRNKKEKTKTGGGPTELFSFSASEEAVIAVSGLDATTGMPDTLSFGDINNNTITINNNNTTEMGYDGEEIFDTGQIEPTTTSGIGTTSTPRRPTQNSTRDNPPSSQSKCVSESLIKTQLEIQEEFHRNMTNKIQAVKEGKIGWEDTSFKELLRMKIGIVENGFRKKGEIQDRETAATKGEIKIEAVDAKNKH